MIKNNLTFFLRDLACESSGNAKALVCAIKLGRRIFFIQFNNAKN